MNSKKIIGAGVAVLALLAAALLLREPGSEQEYNARLDGRIFDVAAKAPGLVKKVDVQGDMFVSKDFPLLELDNPEIIREYDQARSSLIAISEGSFAPGASMNVGIGEFEARVAAAADEEALAKKEAGRLSVALAEASLSRRKIEANLNAHGKDKLAHAKMLEETLLASLDEAKARLEQASLNRFRAEQDLNAVKEQRRILSTPQGTEALRQVELESARNKFAASEERVGGLRPLSPVDGYVLDVFVKQGVKVAAGDRLLSIVPLDPEFLWITAFFDEKTAARLSPGDECGIVFNALDGLVLSGKVKSVRPATLAFPLPEDGFSANFDNPENLVPVIVSIDDYDPAQMPQLRLGMTAMVTPKSGEAWSE